MSIVTMGYILAALVVALIWAIMEMLMARSSKHYYQDLWQQTQTTSLERLSSIAGLKAEIALLNEDRSIRAEVHERTEKNLRTSHELNNHYIEEIAGLEVLIKAKDEELNYYEDYIKNGEHAHKMVSAERDRILVKVAELEREPEYVRACLLEKIHDCKNLQHLNELLEDANGAYCRELKEERAMVDHLVRQLKDNNIEPDLEPNEAATSAEPNPAEEPIEESCCF